MRVLVTTIPGLGHFHPMVPLARALVAAGHEVRVAGPESFSPFVSAARLEPVTAGPDWLESEADTFYPGFTQGSTTSQFAAFAEMPKRGLVADVVALAEAWGPDVVLHDHLEFSGWIGAELLGIPNVPFAMTVRALDEVMLSMMIPEQVGDLLAHFGLPGLDQARPDRWLYLDSIPPSFCGMFFPPGETVHSIRYCTDDRTGQETLPAWIEDLGDRPLVYVTLGTIFNRAPGTLAKLVEGAAGHDVDVVVTTGRNLDPMSLGPLPDNVRAERYVPQADLIPRCDAVVCHGGFNTVFGALAEGVPVVVVPLSADQPLNAFLCQSTGLGVSCTTEQPEGSMFPLARPDALVPSEISKALEKILHDASYANAARQMQQEIAAQPGVEHGVALMEQLVATGEPVTNSPPP